jgi:deoxyhypusine synthase
MQKVKDLAIDAKTSVSSLLEAYDNAGFQATNVARAAKLFKRMRADGAYTILSFTANLVAAGLRGTIAKLCERKCVDMIITTGGSVDHDLIKAYGEYDLADFRMDDVALNAAGVNRLGNILIANKHYELLEKKLKPVFMRHESEIVSPSQLIREIGETLDDPHSFLHWCAKKDIPVFSPGITDSAVGLQTYFFKQDHPKFGIDVTADMKRVEDTILVADKVGAVILGGGISKHHTIGVNILRGGLDYALYITTAQEYDGSLSGATASEAKSWSKIEKGANTVTVYGDATLVFPLVAAPLL